jgi:hypothetical protein
LTSSHQTCPATLELTFSLGSGDGSTLSASRVGPRTVTSGPALVLANPSLRPAKGRAKRTSDISGPSFDASSPSAVLQSSLESRLRVGLAGSGSPEYALTWKHWAMRSGPPICAQRGSGRRTSDNGCTGWPTPLDRDYKDTSIPPTRQPGGSQEGCLYLGMAAQFAGWPTPNAIPEGRGGLQSNPEKALERRAQGHMLNLDDAATLAGWATPAARDYRSESATDEFNEDRVRQTRGKPLSWEVTRVGATPGSSAAAR